MAYRTATCGTTGTTTRGPSVTGGGSDLRTGRGPCPAEWDARPLKDFEDQGIIEVRRHEILIVDLAGLPVDMALRGKRLRV